MFNKSSSKPEKGNLDNIPINTVIDEGLLVKGNISGDGAIRVDGKVEGNIDLTKGIILGEKSKINGTIKSDIIIVHGTLQGNLSCRQLYIKSTGVIEGDIEVVAFEVELGGKYNGTLKMKNSDRSANNEPAKLKTADTKN